MARAGVPSDHAERVLAHVQGGVQGTYDRYEYVAEKKEALAKLQALLKSILKGEEARNNLVGQVIETVTQRMAR